MTYAGTAHSHEAGTSHGWLAVSVFLVLYALGHLDRQILTLMVEPIREDLGVSDFQISLLSGGAFVLCYTLCALPIGWLVDRAPRRAIIFGGVMIWSLATAACGLTKTYWQLLLCRCGVGAGEAALAPSAYSILSDLFPRDRLAGAMAVFSTGAVVGGALSLMLGGLIVGLAADADSLYMPLVGEVRPWQFVFLLAGIPGLILAFLVFLVKEPRRKGLIADAVAVGQPKGSVFSFIRQQPRFFAAHFVGFGLMGLIMAGKATWAPTYLIRAFDWPVERVGLVLGGQTLFLSVAGMLFSGYLVDHLFRRGIRDAHFRYYAWMVGVGGTCGVVATLSSNIIIVLIAFGIMQFIAPFLAVAATALQITTPNEYRGQVSALFLFVYNVAGYGLGPALIAGISDFLLGGSGNIGLAMAITFGICTPITIAVFILGLRPLRRAIGDAERWTTT